MLDGQRRVGETRIGAQALGVELDPDDDALLPLLGGVLLVPLLPVLVPVLVLEPVPDPVVPLGVGPPDSPELLGVLLIELEPVPYEPIVLLDVPELKPP